MRIESSVTAISWIPSEAIEGMPKIPFELGIGHYDEPPPDRIAPGDLARLRDEDRFREANDLRAWIEVPYQAVRTLDIVGGRIPGVDFDDSHLREGYDRLDRVRDEVLANFGLFLDSDPP